MFVFSSILVVASWFVAMLLWDRLLRPGWRERRPTLRYACITATGCALAAGGFGLGVASFYGAKVGVIAAFWLAPVYVFIAVVLRVLLRSFEMDVDAAPPPSNEG